MDKQTLEQLLKEYAELHNAPMTVGERFSTEGQAKLDREYELLDTLAAAYNTTTFDFVLRFEMGWL